MAVEALTQPAVAHRLNDAAYEPLALLDIGAADVGFFGPRVSRDAPDAPGAALLIAGARAALRGAMQRFLAERLDPEQRWLMRWLLGRWPRGRLVVGMGTTRPGSPMPEGSLTLGLVAPLTPTRLALSQGPLPFSKPSVDDFKALHAATAAQGLEGCRLHFDGRKLTHLAGRWAVPPSSLPGIVERWGLRSVAAELAVPLAEDLLAGVPPGSAQTVLEAAYTPEPPDAFTLEVGPLPVARLRGLLDAAMGAAGAEALMGCARDLRTRRVARAALRFDADGLAEVEARLPMPGTKLPKRF